MPATRTLLQTESTGDTREVWNARVTPNAAETAITVITVTAARTSSRGIWVCSTFIAFFFSKLG